MYLQWTGSLYLMTIAQQMDFPEDQVHDLSLAFAFWCNQRFIVPFQNHLHSSALAYWTCVNSAKSNFFGLSEIALKLLQIVSSEAPCERIISETRRLVGQRRTRMSPETIFDLLILSKK